jgi:YfiH family protein
VNHERAISRPGSWLGFDGLVAGFGDRVTEPPADRLVRIRQVHGAAVVDVSELATGTVHDVPGDVLISRRAGVLAGVVTADCVPILLVEPARRWAAAVHAGWRGTLAGAVSAAVDAALGVGLRARDLHAALGPAIGSCCYEVGGDIAYRFEDAGLPVDRPGAGARARLDLRACNRDLLKRANLRPERIEIVGPCTRCRSDRYHSYRADGEKAGRQTSWVGWEVRAHEPGA